jgi:hypothetical protein
VNLSLHYETLLGCHEIGHYLFPMKCFVSMDTVLCFTTILRLREIYSVVE